MAFGRAHKIATYIAVWCSFGALGLSGELSDPAVLMAFFGIVASWWWEAPRVRVERWARLWSGAGILVLAYSIFAAVSGDDLVLVGAELLLFLTVAKLFTRLLAKDYQQVYILAFLMMVAATVLNATLSFALFFLGFVISSTWALILLHLRMEIEESLLVAQDGRVPPPAQATRIMASRRIVGPGFFAGTAAVSILVFAGAAVLFLAVPRIGFGLFFNKGRGGVHLTGFSDGVRLGGHGLIKNDDTVVMRVKVDKKWGGRNAPYIHWRGVAFDYYSLGQWRRSRIAPRTDKRIRVDHPYVTHHLLYDRSATAAQLDERMANAMRQDIYLEPLGYDVLFGAAMPVAFRIEPQLRSRVRFGSREQNDEIRHPHSSGIRYTVYSAPERPPDQVLKSSQQGPLPPGYDVYLQVAPEVTDRVRQKALELTAGLESDFDKAVAIESWLQESFDYTLELESPRGKEPIDFFLFQRQKGHCEYFSSAMAVMLRVAGVPTRNVNGFLGGEWNEYSDYIAVRAGDAHSWVEVYLGDAGWVTFDPTPAGSVDQLGRGGGGAFDKLRRLADVLRFQWFKWVIDYDLARQLKALRNIGKFFRGGAGRVFGDRWQGLSGWIRDHKAAAAGGLAALAAGIIGLVLWRRRRAGGSGASGTRRRDRDPIALAYQRAHRLLARRGFGKSEFETPREHARALRESGAPGAQTLADITELYYAAEYGGRSDSQSRERAHELVGQLEDQLRQHKRRRRAAVPN